MYFRKNEPNKVIHGTRIDLGMNMCVISPFVFEWTLNLFQLFYALLKFLLQRVFFVGEMFR